MDNMNKQDNKKEQTDKLIQDNASIEWDAAQTEAQATKQDNVPQVQVKITTGSQFYYLGGLFTIGSMSESDDIVYIKDDNDNIFDIPLSLFKSRLRDGIHVMKENVPQVKTVEERKDEITRETELIREFVFDWKREVGLSHEFVTGLEYEDIFEAIRCYSIKQAAPLQSRIAELEASNAKLREALENIASATDGNNPGHAVFYFEARKALNIKEVGGEI